LDNQIYVTTWGGANPPTPPNSPSGLWVCTPPEEFPVNDPAPMCTELWNVTKYEVDPVTATSLVGGAVVAYQGDIYWGLMQVPLTGFLAHEEVYGMPKSIVDTLTAIADTTRAIPIFRYNPGTMQTQLLYGAATLPVFTNGKWITVPNASGQKPLFGPPGFGNPFNTYTWAGNVYQNRLYFGTFDWSYLLTDGLIGVALGNTGISPSSLTKAFKIPNLTGNYGADLWRFDSANGPAKAESTSGLGNYLNYGIRTMVSDDCHLYVGMANPMNLKTMPNQGKPPLKNQLDGGWELRVLTGSTCAP
jgi:hypothetical protein